jgi:hypothetical protein
MKEVIEKFQCPGCIYGGDINCGNFKDKGNKCLNHKPGTMRLGIGKIFLGLPIGFDRLGVYPDMLLYIFENKAQLIEEWGDYDIYNVPVWKHKDKEGVIFIRGLLPRKNEPFLHIILEGNLEDFSGIEITEEMRGKMS